MNEEKIGPYQILLNDIVSLYNYNNENVLSYKIYKDDQLDGSRIEMINDVKHGVGRINMPILNLGVTANVLKDYSQTASETMCMILMRSLTYKTIQHKSII
jgi:hypothetical protein